MSKHAVQSLRHYLRQVSEQSALLADAELLRQFVDANDHQAFEILLQRHGPMVLGTARRLVNNAADAADVFQAVFLSLARQAKSIRQRQLVANWLHTTTCRVAARARKRRVDSIENAPEPSTASTAETDLVWREVRTALDEELQRLPERLRLPLLLCYLSGLTRDEAAEQLGWSISTLKRRLEEGRTALRKGLDRRGISAAGLALAVLSPSALDAAVCPALAKSCLDAVDGKAVAGRVSALILTTTTTIKGVAMKAVIVSLALVGLGFGMHASFGRADRPTPTDGKKKDGSPAPKQEPTAARKLIDQLRVLKPENGGQALNDTSAAVLRELVKLGPAAVPDVIAELDATTDPFLLRCLGFAARAIGDPRVVPALIRALPKTCQPPSSDFARKSADPVLLAFMQAHSQRKQGPGAGGTHYSFGRPINEFRTALQALTKANHGEDELTGISLGGSARQQYLQRDHYRRCAERWAAWWEKNANQFVADPEYAKAGLPPRPPVVAAPVAAEFPRGPRAEAGYGMTGGLLESVGAKGAKCVFMDLDTGRWASLPEKFRPAAGKPERLDDIIAWAAEEGYDLMGTEYTPPGGGEPHYVIRGLGLTAWQIDTGRRKTLEEEVKADKPLEMGKKVGGGLLPPVDGAAGKNLADETGLFLFRTREGGFGWIFVGVEVHDDTLKPGMPAQRDVELWTVGGNKGRRFAYTLAWDGAADAGRRK